MTDKNDDNYIYYLVGKNMRKYRKQQGLSQDKLADLCNYTTSFISRMENSTFQTFSLNTVYHISRVLGIPVKLLFEELEEDT